MTSTSIQDPLSGLSLERLHQRTSMKWQQYPSDVLPMWIAEMDVDLAPEVVEALKNVIELGDTGYPAGNSYEKQLQILAKDRWGYDGYDLSRMALSGDVMQGITALITCVTEPGGIVIVTPPIYPPFYAYPQGIHRRVVEAALDDHYRLDFRVLETVFAEHANADAVFLLCNPHNPTGTVHTEDELRRLAALADEYGVIVISDEIHALLVSKTSTFVPYLKVAGSAPAFSVFSASKAWNLAGIKAAVVASNVGGKDIFDTFTKMQGRMPSHLGVLSHVAAMKNCSGWLDALLESIDHKKQLFCDLVEQELPELICTVGQGTYLAWVDASKLPLTTTAYEFFLKEGKVAFNPGETFGTGGASHVRVNLATSEEIIREAVARMKTAIAALMKARY